MLVLCEVAQIAKVRTKNRRMNVNELNNHEPVVCKFLECLQVDLDLQTKTYNETKSERRPRTKKKWYNDDEENKADLATNQKQLTNYLGSDSEDS
jgi:hypothetical protein